jgi:hypothetical protein
LKKTPFGEVKSAVLFQTQSTAMCTVKNLLLGGLLILASFFVPSAMAEDSQVEFLRDVRPILSGHCFKCHGPDEEARKSKLRLDIREEALKPVKSGKIAIQPNDPDKSELVRRILTSDTDDQMPPPEAKLPLSEKDKAILKQWVASGAEYKTHWAFLKPTQTALPPVKNKSWPRNEIDFFVLARLEKEGLKPSPPADKYTLVRRVYLDLIGLPPTPEQADAFVQDASPDAYEKLLDHLLESPHYGERWARRWLDLARYADTNGYEKDRPRSMWPYRDWVINALNADMPFDQFTLEQLAGDMLPNATASQIIATGFHRNSMINEEGGVDPQEYRFYSMVDRVHVTATTWLGLTMACAQCHTHKYDPIQHGDYYKFMAFLNNADEPRIDVQNPRLKEERDKVEKKITHLEATLADEFPPALNLEWRIPAAPEFSSEHGAEAELLEDGSFRVSGKNPDKETYTLNFQTTLPQFTHLQVEAIPDEKTGKGGPGRTDHGNFVLSEIELQVGDGTHFTPVKFQEANADYAQDGFPPQNAIDGKIDTGWAIDGTKNIRSHRHLVARLAEPLQLKSGNTIRLRLIQNFGAQHTLARFRVSLGNDLFAGQNLAQRSRENLDKQFGKWIDQELPKVVEWNSPCPTEARSENPILTIQSDNSIFASGDFTKSDTYHLKFEKIPAGTKAFRIEVLPDDRLPRKGPGTVHYEGPEGDFWLSNLKAHAGDKELPLRNPSQSYASGDNDAAKAIDNDLQSGWSIDGGQGKAHNAVFQFAEPLSRETTLQLDLTFERYFAAALGRFRIYFTSADNARASGLSDDAYAIFLKAGGNHKSLLTSRDTLLEDFLAVAPELSGKRKEIEQLRRDMPKYPTTLVMQEWPAGHHRATHRHHRGEFLQPKEEVQANVPSFLPPLPPNAPRNRIGLAQWLTSPENPLTARVVVNRHWEAFFGRGLVRTLEDFGFQGELPSHPELLDWMAVEFMKSGWSQKKLQKLIVMSATYQQSSSSTEDLEKRDPENILLAHGPRFRIEAELVRDTALAESGLLSPKLGGPSVFPPQPAGVSTEGAYGPLQWKTSEGADRYRRGLYTFAKRTTPYAMTATFDGPSGEACLARRDRSNTPLQALTLLNDEVFVECARTLGQWAASQSGSELQIAEKLFRRCLTRPPSPQECKKLTAFYQAQLNRFDKGELKPSDFASVSDPEIGKSAAAWATVARVLLNLDENVSKS